MTDHVFVGPTLPPDEVRDLLPGAEILPPVRHGDLLRLGARPGDRVLVIDGFFLHTAPIRHREVLLLVDRGVTVAGASSMGALRAAELWRYGMRGVGEVFTLYRDGVVTGDDEVAIVHGPAEEGYRPLSEPLVNIRVALRTAAAAGVLADAAAGDLLELARELPFRARTYRALGGAARLRRPDLVGDAERFVAWAADHAVDTKAADARLLLRMAADDDPRLCPAGPGDAPIRNLHTHHLHWWRVRSSPPVPGTDDVTEAQAVTALMVTHPDFPAEHRRHVLAALVGADPDDPSVPERAVALARDRGLAADRCDGTSWLVPGDAAQPEPERLLRLLVRAFGTANHRGIGRRTLPSTLDTAAMMAAAGEFVATAELLNASLPATGGPGRSRRLRYREGVVEDTFAGLWGCAPDALVPAVWDRGFINVETFRHTAEPLVRYLRAYGPPDLPAAAPVEEATCPAHRASR